MKRVLNVGSHDTSIARPSQYADFQWLQLDADPARAPDVVCDARQMTALDAGQFDAVYCANVLQQHASGDVRRILGGLLHVLKDGGFAQIRVPDLHEVLRLVVTRGADLDDVLYQTPAGPVTVHDAIYGSNDPANADAATQRRSGFSQKSLVKALRAAGFGKVYAGTGHLEVSALAFKGEPDDVTRRLFKLPKD